jgi:hypothetical protein
MVMLLLVSLFQYDVLYQDYDHEMINQNVLGKVKGNEVNNIKIKKGKR